jgi:chromosome segregation ATPase
MSDLKAAADEARKLVKMLRSVEIIADTFDSIADIENLTSEVNQRLAESQNMEAAAVVKREGILAEAEKVLQDARVEARNEILGAQKAVGAAKLKEESIRKVIDKLVTDIENLKTEASNESAGRDKILAQLDERIAARNKDLYDVESKIIQARETMQKMLAN